MKRLSIGAALASLAITLAPAAAAKCDYNFSGQLTIVHNGVEKPMSDVKVRVRRANGTGLGRDYVRTDADGNFSGAWSFDRDQNGVML